MVNSRASPAIWVRTMLPATRHGWMCTTSTPAKPAHTQFNYPGGMEGWVDLYLCLYQDGLSTGLQRVTHPSTWLWLDRASNPRPGM